MQRVITDWTLNQLIKKKLKQMKAYLFGVTKTLNFCLITLLNKKKENILYNL